MPETHLITAAIVSARAASAISPHPRRDTQQKKGCCLYCPKNSSLVWEVCSDATILLPARKYNLTCSTKKHINSLCGTITRFPLHQIDAVRRQWYVCELLKYAIVCNVVRDTARLGVTLLCLYKMRESCWCGRALMLLCTTVSFLCVWECN